MMAEPVLPYKNKHTGKKEQVAQMFDNISARYDFLNHFLSLGIDKLWRKKAIGLLRKEKPKRILDIATGTGDFALQALSLDPEDIKGIDISMGMLEIGKEKIAKKNLEHKIHLQYGDSENIPFAENKFDAITVGFGVRNFENLEKGLSEMHRVLKNGGTAVILEFSKPGSFPFNRIYNFYFHNILPRIGSKVSKDASAYTYLPESVDAFPEGNEFMDILQNCSFKEIKAYKLFSGIATIYTAKK